MQVYSGSKCAYLPKMMTLHQQCIRVLKNNIDCESPPLKHIATLGFVTRAWLPFSTYLVTSGFSAAIYEVGGVPYSVLEPVLERCTPDQLYRIEECNHVSVLSGSRAASWLSFHK